MFMAILSHLRRVNLKIFSSHGGWLQGNSQPSLNVKSLFRPWWMIIGPLSAIWKVLLEICDFQEKIMDSPKIFDLPHLGIPPPNFSTPPPRGSTGNCGSPPHWSGGRGWHYDNYRGLLSHLRRANLKIFSNHGGWIYGRSQPFQEGKY